MKKKALPTQSVSFVVKARNQQGSSYDPPIQAKRNSAFKAGKGVDSESARATKFRQPAHQLNLTDRSVRHG